MSMVEKLKIRLLKIHPVLMPIFVAFTNAPRIEKFWNYLLEKQHNYLIWKAGFKLIKFLPKSARQWWDSGWMLVLYIFRPIQSQQLCLQDAAQMEKNYWHWKDT